MWYCAAVCGRGIGKRVKSQETGESSPEDYGRSRSTHSSHHLLKRTGGQICVDLTINCGSAGGIEGSGFHIGNVCEDNTEKNELKPWLAEEWCIPKAGAEFVAAMEDVLEVYQRPYTPDYSVVCLDGSNRQLIEETRSSLPVKPGEHEYRRNGVADFFMMFEPLTDRRHVEVRTSRKRMNFAYCIKQFVDVHYPDCKKIVLVMDNLNTHSIASLYEAFSADKALRLAKKIESTIRPNTEVG